MNARAGKEIPKAFTLRKIRTNFEAAEPLPAFCYHVLLCFNVLPPVSFACFPMMNGKFGLRNRLFMIFMEEQDFLEVSTD